MPSALLNSKYVTSSIFPSHIYIRMGGERNFQTHAYLSMKHINFHLQFHFDLQRHLGTWFPLVSSCDLEKIILVLKKETTSAKQGLVFLTFLYSVPSQICCQKKMVFPADPGIISTQNNVSYPLRKKSNHSWWIFFPTSAVQTGNNQ